MPQQFLIATLGCPGSGKTYFSEHFAKEYKIFHLQSDYLRRKCFKSPQFSSEENFVFYKFMNGFAEALLDQGFSVIFDANSNLREYRQEFQQLAQKYHAQYATLWFQAPIEVAYQRTLLRDNQLSRAYIEQQAAEIEPPIDIEPHIVLPVDLDYPEKKALVLKALGITE
ncbi:MAG: ATP-binding protein [Candidatus Buchananbacteria bacterium]|nr:ATP-binding protein [Candidatus Buchananbacteria bacterium]